MTAASAGTPGGAFGACVVARESGGRQLVSAAAGHVHASLIGHSHGQPRQPAPALGIDSSRLRYALVT